MCLNTVTKRFSPPDQAERDAWKIMHKTASGRLKTLFRLRDCPTDEWLTANLSAAPVITHDASCEYKPGFHVFAARDGAEAALRLFLEEDYDEVYANGVITKVKVRGVMCEGTDASTFYRPYLEANLLTFVAKEMFVPSPE